MKSTEKATGVLQIDSQSRSLIESAANLRAQVVAKEVQIQALSSYATGDNPDMIVAQQQLVALKAQLAKLGGSQEGSDAELMVPKGRVPEAAMEYLRRLRDVRYYETISELIAKQFEMAKLDEARQGAVLQVVDLAVPPDTRSFPKRTLTVLLATLLSLFIACTWCVFFGKSASRYQDPAVRQRLDALRACLRS
jgi:tyrosine-protein kinase Etk/Wzc